MKEVNPALFYWLKNYENHLYYEKNYRRQPIDNLQILLFIYHSDISDFINETSPSHFETENMIMVNLQQHYIVIDVSDMIVNHFGHKISDYSSCFPQDEWEEYKNLILESEEG